MDIRYRLDKNGGFAVGIAGTNITSYAYPTSELAVRARRHPEHIARYMLDRDYLSHLPAFVETVGYGRLVERAEHEWAIINAS